MAPCTLLPPNISIRTTLAQRSSWEGQSLKKYLLPFVCFPPHPWRMPGVQERSHCPIMAVEKRFWSWRYRLSFREQSRFADLSHCQWLFGWCLFVHFYYAFIYYFWALGGCMILEIRDYLARICSLLLPTPMWILETWTQVVKLRDRPAPLPAEPSHFPFPRRLWRGITTVLFSMCTHRDLLISFLAPRNGDYTWRTWQPRAFFKDHQPSLINAGRGWQRHSEWAVSWIPIQNAFFFLNKKCHQDPESLFLVSHMSCGASGWGEAGPHYFLFHYSINILQKWVQ